MRPTRSCEVYIDGASRGNPGPAGVGVVFLDQAAKPVRQFNAFLGETTNNVAEYMALLYAMQEALRLGMVCLRVKTDSELLARQVNGQYRVKNPQLRVLHQLAKHLAQGFREFSIAHIPREDNRLADRLAGQAADQQAPVLSQPSITR